MSANEYARQRGRDLPSTPAPLPLRGTEVPQDGEGRKPARPIGEAAQARAAEMRAAVREHVPEALPFIKELHDLGMIDGWRNVEAVELLDDSNQGGRP